MIELSGVSKSYGTNRVLDHFDLSIEEGTINCIMGTSGRGKTTLVRIMMGLEFQDSGQITGLSHLRKSAIFQEDRLCENLSCMSNIQLVCQKRLKKDALINDMSAVGLQPDCFHQVVRTMSGGQRRRIAILRALAAEYDILFMDEPFKGLDPETKNLVMFYTKQRTVGKTVIFVTHDETEYSLLGGRLIYMK